MEPDRKSRCSPYATELGPSLCKAVAAGPNGAKRRYSHRENIRNPSGFCGLSGDRQLDSALCIRPVDAENFPLLCFERYADDAIVHCRTEREAQIVVEAIRGRLAECGLELHPEKTRIVYCKDSNRREDYEHISFDFLGYTFQPREARGRNGKRFTNFLPAISNKAAKGIRQTIRK